MLSQVKLLDLARKLLASDVEGNTPSAKAVRVYEKLRRQLCAPVGVDGFQALASRALTLAKSQSPRLSEVQLLPDGNLSGLERTDSTLGKDEDAEVGLILIVQLLGIFLTLLGEAATVHLIAEMPSQGRVEPRVQSAPAPSTNYFGPFEDILSEADHLRSVSERLEMLADKHAGIEEVMSVAGSIRNIASVLDVFTVIRNKASGAHGKALSSTLTGFLN